jgi:pyruvate ferredoxin oxidoreductase gamma subunit
VLLGATPRTVLLLNSRDSPHEWQGRFNLAGPIVTLAVSGDVEGHTDVPYVGATCAGAAARLVGRITRESLTRAIRDELRDLGEEVVDRNLERALWAYEAIAAHADIVSEGREIAARGFVHPDWIDVPFEAARLSAPDIRVPATSVLTKTGAWRTTRPVIDAALCNRCTWVCSTMCPDSAIRVTGDGRPDIDYDHCKGCLVCVAVCPPHAISAVPETAAMEETP